MARLGQNKQDIYAMQEGWRGCQSITVNSIYIHTDIHIDIHKGNLLYPALEEQGKA
jgi:hypothetical protein